MKQGEIYLADFPFGGGPGTKTRPVLAMAGYLGSVPEVIVAYITSINPVAKLPTDIVIDPTNPTHASTGLKQKSLLRLHRLMTIHQSNVYRYLGKVSTQLQAEVDLGLRSLLNL